LWLPFSPGGKEPLYRQLVDMILLEVDQGLLLAGSRLPTVRELAAEMKLSGGTVKHAYDVLERLGVIEKVRGRGTFVCSRDNEGAQGKKNRAMRLIDGMLDEMRDLGFSLRETQIFLDLKLREREDEPLCVKVMAVDCNPETLYIISGQVAQIRGAEVSCRLLDDLPDDPGLLEEEPDIIVTTTNHYERVALVAQEGRVSKVVFSPSRGTVANLAKVGESNRVGILTTSERFARVIRKTRAELVADDSGTPNMLLGADGIEDFLSACNTVIVPNHYAHFCLPSEIAAIKAFQETGGSVIEFIYHIDAGSLMYLEQQITRILKEKSRKL